MQEENQRFVLYDLHTHLYGCLGIEDLYRLEKRGATKRWNIFINSYQLAYGEKPNIKGLFNREKEASQRLKNYYCNFPKGFPAFQSSFDLIVSVSDTSPDEIQEVCQWVCSSEDADYAEYRMLFPYPLPQKEYENKICSFCSSLSKAEKSFRKQFRAILSLSRDTAHAFEQYRIVQRLMEQEREVAAYLTGLDFCGQEEGNPPSLKKDFFQKVLQNNIQDPKKALSILYHVGESFSDKSLESSIRWVVESSHLGAHRIGHALCLGIDPSQYEGTTRNESVRERLDQIEFEFSHSEGIAEFLDKEGVRFPKQELRQEAEKLCIQAPSQAEQSLQKISIHYTPERIAFVKGFQNWAMTELRLKKTVIECCPSSNMRIAGLKSAQDHPLKRFLDNGLPVVIASDDRGLLESSLTKELEIIEKWPELSTSDISGMITRSSHSTSEILSGRKTKTIA